jgi:hypothetical protein
MSHLGRVGLTAYVNDILWAEKELKAKLGRETTVRPLPPLILPGCTDKTLIRDIFDLAAWTDQFYRHDRYHLRSSYNEAVNALCTLGEDEQTELQPIRYRLPVQVRNVADELVSTIQWTSCPSKILVSIKPLGYSKEKDLVTSIIAE